MNAATTFAGTTRAAVLGTYRPAAPVFVAGEGRRVFDAEGKSYLDFGSGIGVNAFGYGDPSIRDAVISALDTGLVHTSNLFRTSPAEALAQALADASFADKVFFCNSGAEANEAAFKFARRWARTQGGDAKHEIVSLRGAFHGRLFGALAATDRPSMQQPFLPLMPGVRFVEVGNLDELKAAVSAERTAAIIAEPVQGEGGVKPLPREFVQALRAAADAANALLIFDEVQCGLGRTGSLFAYEQFGVEPDLLTLAKPLAGGLPMGAVLLSEQVASTIQPGDHATTFGGGPLVATVALTVLQQLSSPSFLAQVQQRGEELEQALLALKALPSVAEVRGIGMMWGIELNTAAGPIVAAALEAGLLVTSAGEKVIRLLPPLNLTSEELAEGMAILQQVLS